MINKNQFEKSVIVLKENVPIFVRNSYSRFATILQQTIDTLKLVSDRNPSSANKLAGEILFGNVSVLNVLRTLSGEEGSKKILKDLTKLNICAHENQLTPDEIFSIVNGTDVYAPVEHICAVVTPFSSETAKCELRDSPIPVVIEVCKRDYVTATTSESKDYGFGFISSDEIEDMTGARTALDDMSACCGIDIDSMFDKFFKLLSSGCSRDSKDYIAELSNIYNAINDTNSREAVSYVSEIVLASAMSAYFVFASKLIGSKKDIYDWMYTSFVKDSMNHFDKSHYPVNANITKVSGHGETGRGNGVNPSFYEESPMNIELNEYSNGSANSDKSWKAMIYRNIRLQYSSWASVINAILSTSFRRRANGQCTGELYRNMISKYGTTNFAGSESEYSKICDIISETLVLYAGAKYRTYNTSVQLTNELKPEDSSKLIEMSVKQVKDEYAVQCVKDSVYGCSVKDTFIPWSTATSAILTFDNNAKNCLADTFMESAYLLLLNYVHATMSKVLEETDMVTGKTNKVLFEEIYSGVKHKIYMDIETYSTLNSRSTISESLLSYTPYHVSNNSFTECEALKDVTMMSRSLVSQIESIIGLSSEEKVSDWFNPYIDIIVIPIVSAYNKLKNICDFKFGSYSEYNSNNRLGSPFPKNKIIVDGISKFGRDITNHRVFKTLESADEYVKELSNRVEEGADAMASNACYSALGSIGGGITEIEIRSDPADNSLGDGVAPLTDNSGMAIKAGTTDTADLANAVSHALESAAPKIENEGRKVVGKYNDLFNKFILGI